MDDKLFLAEMCLLFISGLTDGWAVVTPWVEIKVEAWCRKNCEIQAGVPAELLEFCSCNK